MNNLQKVQNKTNLKHIKKRFFIFSAFGSKRQKTALAKLDKEYLQKVPK